MLYYENRSRYRHVFGTKMSAMPTFIVALNIFMGLKIDAFRVIKEKPHFWADILDFGGRPLWILRGPRYFWIEWGSKSMCTNFHACIRNWTILAIFGHNLLHYKSNRSWTPSLFHFTCSTACRLEQGVLHRPLKMHCRHFFSSPKH